MRKKLVVNAVVNPLTAILGCRNGALFKDEASKRMLQDIYTEAAAVFQAQLAREADAQTFLSSLAPDAREEPSPFGPDATRSPS
jgi:2-dehydropantoate 2-reductase